MGLESREVERRGLPFFIRHLDDEYGKNKWMLMPHQVQGAINGCGDARVTKGIATALEIEAKFDDTTHPNLFVETWSCKERNLLGWIHTSKANWLWYFWMRAGLMLKVDMRRLQYWHSTLCSMREKPVRGYADTYDTWGVAVSRDYVKGHILGTVAVPFDNREWFTDESNRRAKAANA